MLAQPNATILGPDYGLYRRRCVIAPKNRCMPMRINIFRKTGSRAALRYTAFHQMFLFWSLTVH
jgi:hypothetical protein